jgi:RNA polymerase sigma-70 factor (ECF subfamily)
MPEAWVRRVAFNLAHNRWRRLARDAAALVRLGRPASVPPLSVDELALVQALKTLPARQREAIVLHHLAGVPVEQVAAHFGAPTGTVKSWLSRGRAALALTMAEHPARPVEEVHRNNG